MLLYDHITLPFCPDSNEGRKDQAVVGLLSLAAETVAAGFVETYDGELIDF